MAVKRGKINAMRDGTLKNVLIAAERNGVVARTGGPSVSYRQEPVPLPQVPVQKGRPEFYATVQPVRLGELGDLEESASHDTWGGLPCMKKSRVDYLFERNSIRSQ